MAKNFGIVNPDDYKGLIINEAEQIALQNGFITRIVEENGVSKILTMDLKSDRINFRIKNNIVIDVYPG